MKGLLLTVCAAFSLSISAAAQQAVSSSSQCNLSINRAPELFGFRLGMTVDEVRARYANLKVSSPDAWGDSTGSVDPAENSRAQKNYKWLLTNISSVNLDFYQGKLSYVGLIQSPSMNWSDLRGYTANLSRAFGLPEAWTDYEKMGGVKQLKCGTFDLLVFNDPAAAILLFDTAATDAFDKQVKDYQADQFRRAIRP